MTVEWWQICIFYLIAEGVGYVRGYIAASRDAKKKGRIGIGF